jgi:class 3 adenylate cyclase
MVLREIQAFLESGGDNKRKSFSGQEAKRNEFEAAVLFADMSGFTALTERLAGKPNGAEKLCDALNDFFAGLLETVEEYGGDVVKFSGDALQIIWPVDPERENAPKTLQEATLLGARCSDTVHKKLCNYPKTHGVTLTMHMGLGAGKVTMLYVGGTYGRWESVVGGPPIAQTGIAEPLAGHGETVFSPEVYELVKDFCECTPVDYPHEEYMIQGAFKVDMPPLTVPEVLQLKPMHIHLTKSFIPNAIYSTLQSGYASYLAEMRELSVLFIKIVGLSVDGPSSLEDTHAMMKQVQKSTYKFEGSINKLICDDKGTLVLVGFGLPPFAHMDDPMRAIAAAFDMRKGLNELGLHVSIGVTTSDLFCGVVGSHIRREYTVYGDGVNLSARLVMHAQEDQILVDESTAMACLDQVCFTTLATVKVKGKIRPVKPFEPTAWFNAIQRTGPMAKTMELVGRSKEKQELSNKVDHMISSKKGILCVIGDHGIGKTSFVHHAATQTAISKGLTVLGSHLGTSHFLEVMPGRKGGNTEWEASLKEIDVLDSFKAWEAVIVQAIGMSTQHNYKVRSSFFNYDSSAKAMRDKLESLLPGNLKPWMGVLRELLPGLQIEENEECEKLTPVKRDQLQQDLLSAVLCDVSANKPVMCLLDTCHTLDDCSWRLLETVRQLTDSDAYTGAGVMVCFVSRQMHHTDFKYQKYTHAIECARDGQTYMELGRFEFQDFHKYLHHCLNVAESKPLPQTLVDYLWEKSQGNPFFVKEIVDNLLAEQAIHVLEGQCILNDTKPLSQLAAPKSLSLIMKMTVDQLNSHEQVHKHKNTACTASNTNTVQILMNTNTSARLGLRLRLSVRVEWEFDRECSAKLCMLIHIGALFNLTRMLYAHTHTHTLGRWC